MSGGCYIHACMHLCVSVCVCGGSGGRGGCGAGGGCTRGQEVAVNQARLGGIEFMNKWYCY